MRQSPPGHLVVRTLAAGYSSGTVLEHHAHDWAQLVYACEGVMSVRTENGTWVVPSHRGVWIPARVGHSIAMSGWVSMRTLYLAPAVVRDLPSRCCVLPVPPLLRELILHAVAKGPLHRDVPEQRRLIDFLRDQLRTLPVMPLELPMPRDARALRLAQRWQEEPAAVAPLDDLVHTAGASRRTLERIFQRETGMSLGRWRQQARLLRHRRWRGAAVRRLRSRSARGPSAFIAAFSLVLGTAGRYLVNPW
jgi:AraC-like DNA-binding protein